MLLFKLQTVDMFKVAADCPALVQVMLSKGA